MRKVSLSLALVFCAIIFCGTTAFCDSRYYFVTESIYHDKLYIDTQSIINLDNNIIRFWEKRILTPAGREAMFPNVIDTYRKALNKCFYILSCVEINLSQNMFRTIEANYYSANMELLFSDKLSMYPNSPRLDWSNIAPETISEVMRDTVLLILQNNSSHNIPQPFIKPRPQYSPTPLPQGNFTPYQRQEWQKLQEYNAWLASQADFPEFNNWYLAKLRSEGVTPEQVNQYLMNQAMEKGGQFTIIIGIVSGWYREFYKERYGGR